MKSLPIRRVVTRVDNYGSASFTSDGMPPNTGEWRSGIGVSELLWFDGPTWDLMTPIDRTPIAPSRPLSPGGLSSRIVRCSTNDDWQNLPIGLREKDNETIESLDLLYVLEGSLTLGLEEEELTLQAGDVVIQQGVVHRWRIAAEPAVLWATSLRPQPGDAALELSKIGGSSGVRRIITGSRGVHIDEAPGGPSASGNAMKEIWQTGGPLVSVSQGGDVSGPFDLEPAGEGVALR